MRRSEVPPPVESEKPYTSRIELRIFRHSKKEGSGFGAHDHGVRLTPEGRMLAKEKSPKDINVEQSVAFSSPRVRAQETAGFVLAGGQDEITGNESLEELQGKIDADVKYGSKMGIDDRLDFTDDLDTPYGQQLKAAEARGEYTKFVIEESDRAAKEIGDISGATYAKKAANIASIIEKYVKIAPRWDRLVQDKDKHYSETLERYFATHTGNGESFLAKVMEKTDGIEKRDEFVRALGSQGFNQVEGFKVDIESNGAQEPTVRVSYEKELPDKTLFSFEKVVPMKILREIIEEGAEN